MLGIFVSLHPKVYKNFSKSLPYFHLINIV